MSQCCLTTTQAIIYIEFNWSVGSSYESNEILICIFLIVCAMKLMLMFIDIVTEILLLAKPL